MPITPISSSEPISPLENLLNPRFAEVNDDIDALALEVAGVGDEITATRQIQTFIWADSTERSAQTGMVEGDYGWQSDIDLGFHYYGGSWHPMFNGGRVIPTSISTGGSIDATGVVTSSAQSLVRIGGVWPTSGRVFRVDYDATMSASSILLRLSLSGTDSTTGYDYNRTTEISTSVATVQDLNQGSGSLSPLAIAGARHVGSFEITSPNVAEQTFYNARSTVSPSTGMTASTGGTSVAGMHRAATAYNELTLTTGSGTITINRLTITQIS